MDKSKKRDNNADAALPVGGVRFLYVEKKKRNKNKESQPTKSDKKKIDKTRKEENNLEENGDSSQSIKIENETFEEKTNCSDNLQSEIKQYSVDNKSTSQTILNISNNEILPNLMQQTEVKSDSTENSNYSKKESGEEFTRHRGNRNKSYSNNRYDRNDKDNSYRKYQYRSEGYNTNERNLEKEHDHSGRNANFQGAWGNTRNNRSSYNSNMGKRVDSGKIQNNYDDDTVARTNAETKKEWRDNNLQRNLVSTIYKHKENSNSTKNDNWNAWEDANVSKSEDTEPSYEDAEPSYEDANQLSGECQNKMQLNQDSTDNSFNQSRWQGSPWGNKRNNRGRGSDFKNQDAPLKRRDNNLQRNLVSIIYKHKEKTDSTKNDNWNACEDANVSKSEDTEPSYEDANQLPEECQNKMQLNQDSTDNSFNQSRWQGSPWESKRSSRGRGADFKNEHDSVKRTDVETKGNWKDKNLQKSMVFSKRKENDNWHTWKDNNVSNPENAEQPYEEPNKFAKGYNKMGSYRGDSSGDDSFNQNRFQNFSKENKRSIRGRSYLENEDEEEKTPDKYHNKSFNQGQYRFLERVIEDKNFHQWLQKNPEINYKHIEETEGDLFEASEESSLAHCVAEDMGMGSGIAVGFRQQFKRVDQLLDQRQRSGGLALLEEKGRFIYYLVTKKNSTGKPTLTTLWSSLRKLRDHMLEHKVSQLAIPRIGCGLDRLEWQEVKPMIEYMFLDTDVSVTVYNLPKQAIEGTPSRIRNCKVVHVEHPVADIEEYTIIIYLCSEKGEITKEIEELDKKFNILPSYRNAVKRRGEIIRNVKGSYILYGCVVKKEINDEISFVEFRKCIQTLKIDNKKDRFDYVAIEAFEDERDDIIMKKIINILRNTLIKVDVYVCWPKGIPTEMSQE